MDRRRLIQGTGVLGASALVSPIAAQTNIEMPRMADNLTAEELVRLLQLEPNATCGFVRVTFLSKHHLSKGTLSPHLKSYRRILVTEGSGGSGLNSRSNNLEAIGELYTENDFLQLVVAIEAPPGFFGGLGEFEDHGERGFV
jgi:hypothetical protein